jgi:hypothetical protein
MLNFNISYYDLIKFPYSTNPTKNGVWEVKGDPKKG